MNKILDTLQSADIEQVIQVASGIGIALLAMLVTISVIASIGNARKMGAW